MKRNILWSAIFATTLLFTACKKREVDTEGAKNTVEKTTENVRDKMAELKQQAAGKTADFETSINEKMSRLDTKLVKLEAKGDAKSRDEAAEFRARRDELKTKVQQLGEATDDSISSLETAITASWDRLESDVDAAI